MILWDAIFAAYCRFGARRGARRKLSGILTRLIRKGLAVLVGLGCTTKGTTTFTTKNTKNSPEWSVF